MQDVKKNERNESGESHIKEARIASAAVKNATAQVLRRQTILNTGSALYQFLLARHDEHLRATIQSTHTAAKAASLVLTGYPSYQDAYDHNEGPVIPLIKGASVAMLFKYGMESMEGAIKLSPMLKLMEESIKSRNSKTSIVAQQTAKGVIKVGLLAPLLNTFITQNKVKDKGYDWLTTNLATTIGVISGMGTNLAGAGLAVSGAAETSSGVLAAPGIASIAGGAYLISQSANVSESIALETANGIEKMKKGCTNLCTWVSDKVTDFLESQQGEEKDGAIMYQSSMAQNASNFTEKLLNLASSQGVEEKQLLLLHYFIQSELSSKFSEEPSKLKANERLSKNVKIGEVKAELDSLYDNISANDGMRIQSDEIKAQFVLEAFKQELSHVLHSWASADMDITGFEDCDAVKAAATALQKCEPQKIGTQGVTKLRNNLKHAMAHETLKRAEFDKLLDSAEGAVNLSATGSYFLGNSKLSNQIIKGGSALVTIGKNIAGLLGYGSLAASINPIAAAGCIGLAACSLFDDGNDAEELQYIEEMITYLRVVMLERFDCIDKKLEEVHKDIKDILHKTEMLALQGKQTQLIIKRAAEDSKKFHETTHSYLHSLQQQLQELYGQSRGYAVEQSLRNITDPITASVNHIESIPSPEQYGAWLAQFQTFFQQTAYSAILSGDSSRHCINATFPQGFHRSSANEGFLYLNQLPSYLGVTIPSMKKMPLQPNFLVWSYSVLAITRLIYLTNHNEQAQIRRAEFELLNYMRRDIAKQREFTEALAQPEVVNSMLGTFQYGLKEFAKIFRDELKNISDKRNDVFAENMNLVLEKRWSQQRQTLEHQAIEIGLNYSGWYQNWCVTHYGTTEWGRGQQAVSGPKSSYQRAREQEFKTFNIAPRTPPASTEHPGIDLKKCNLKNLGQMLEVKASDIPVLAIEPEEDKFPIINLFANKSSIKLHQYLNIDESCYQGQYLGLGESSYHYRHNVSDKSIQITARFKMKGSFYQVGQASFPLDTGVYAGAPEGVVWAWLGSSSIKLQRVSHNWIGTTGESKHWFIDYADVPVIQYMPNQSLTQKLSVIPSTRMLDVEDRVPMQEDVKKIKTVVDEAILKELQARCAEIQKVMLSSKFSVRRERLERQYNYIHLFLMLANHDKFNDFDTREKWIFGEGALGMESFYLNNLFDDIPNNLEKIIKLPDLLERLSLKIVERIKNKDYQRHISQRNSTHRFFEEVSDLIETTYKFYEHRIDDSGTYQDIFKKNKKTEENLKKTNGLIGIIAKSVLKNVSDPSVLEDIMRDIQEDCKNLSISVTKETKQSIQEATQRCDKKNDGILPLFSNSSSSSNTSSVKEPYRAMHKKSVQGYKRIS